MLKNDTEVRYEDSKINLYVLESTVPQRATLESLYKDILNLGKIFGIEDRAVKLAEDMQNRITILTRGLVLQKHVRVFVYDGCENLPSTASGGTFENSLITAAGGENVFGGEKEPYIRVTWEQIAGRNPDVILVHDFADHISAREKIQILKERRELETVSAVKNNRFLIVSLQEVFPGIQNVNVIEKFIRFFYPYAL
ncbi:MAG: ABC transporter substrate-binding protein [Lachnospiraceae bacterium]|nr:ABC transporter substrate-binding protein [Lachnospiraceae bacterium]